MTKREAVGTAKAYLVIVKGTSQTNEANFIVDALDICVSMAERELNRSTLETMINGMRGDNPKEAS